MVGADVAGALVAVAEEADVVAGERATGAAGREEAAANLEVAANPNVTRVKEWVAAGNDRPVSRVATRGGRTI